MNEARKRYGRNAWLAAAMVVVPAVAVSQQITYGDLTWELRWAIADSLLEESRQVGNAGDVDHCLALLDEALRAHPSHYQSWVSRWRWLMKHGRDSGVADSVIAGWVEADLPKVAAGDDVSDRPYVLSIGWLNTYQLTGREDYLGRRRQVLRDYLQAHPDNDRAFEFKVTLGLAASEDDEARRWYDEALAKLPRPHSVCEVARSMARRDLEHPYLTPAEVDSVYSWWGRGAFGGHLDRTQEMIHRALWRGRYELMRNVDLTAVESHLQDIDVRRLDLVTYEDWVRRLNPDSPLAPFSMIDASTDQLRGDLATVRGDSSAARSYYRSAWRHIEPLAPHWQPGSRGISDDITRLREELLPHVDDDTK